MNLQSKTLCDSLESMREIITLISEYSLSDIIITDENFNIIFYDSKYNENVNFITLFDIIDDLLNDNLRIKLNNFKNSDKNHLYIKLLLKNNKKSISIPADIHFCKIKNRKKTIKGYIIIIQDVINEIRNRIQKETFIDIISHDLKNPMRANIQILELILSGKFGYINKELKNVLEELLHSCNFMKYMADNLIIKYNNEFQAKELIKKKYSIVKLIKDNCKKLMKLIDRKKQTVEMIICNKVPDVLVDIEEMEKVIKNLLISASNESKENSKIYIKIKSDTENVSVSFINNNQLVNTKILDNLFDEYISCSNKFRKIGFSLELYNCRKVIEAHGGSITAQSPGQNSRNITITIPIYSE